ncbi:MAG: aminotransferase class I/II-fold pyridoxal phosphate-dependent enzyme [Parasphingopyxis sp.]|uniref:aminotransferase class I/II-fold pyridoxal phosphate-dependent enzyme n=1 Tax=Parasphingopyxis sp. TaxID=1920299 RepID=UPI0032EDC51F
MIESDQISEAPGSFRREKISVSDLAAFGGAPLFSSPLHVTRPNAGDKERFFGLVEESWERRWFTNDGVMVADLETRLADRLGVKHCITASSGTAAMELAIRALELAGSVIVPAFTFVSTAHMLHWAGIRPVFADIDPRNWALDPESCRKKIAPDVSAVIATHPFGMAADIEALQALCDKEGIPLLFDSAHAFGCTYQGKPIGGFGRAEIFSFHATKAFHTFEGGAITTNDDALAADLRSMRNFGFSGYDQVERAGTNAKMSEIHAAMGLTNLDAFDDILAASARCFQSYEQALRDIGGITMRLPNAADRSNHHYVAAETDSERLGVTRDQLLDLLGAEGVYARRYFYPGTHCSEPYRTLFPDAGAKLPVTEALLNRIIQFPAGATVDGDDVRALGNLLRFIAAHAAEIAEALAQRD